MAKIRAQAEHGKDVRENSLNKKRGLPPLRPPQKGKAQTVKITGRTVIGGRNKLTSSGRSETRTEPPSPVGRGKGLDSLRWTLTRRKVCALQWEGGERLGSPISPDMNWEGTTVRMSEREERAVDPFGRGVH